MIRHNWNEGWTVNPMDGYQLFLNPEGAKRPVGVTLPYDAMQLEDRSPEIPQGRNTGYYPSLETTFSKDFEVPEGWRNQCVYLEFEGVYRSGMVYINGQYAGSCPHGYTCFKVQCDPFLKYGEKNTIKVMAKTHQDSRWYTGAGILRDVNLMVGGICHLLPDGLRVTTPEVDEEGALVQIETEIRNEGHQNTSLMIETIITDAQEQIVAKSLEPLTLYGGETEKLLQRLYVPGAVRWQVEAPCLYTAHVQVTAEETLLDEGETAFGIRTLSLDPRHGLRINGQEVKLRGACIHHDNGLLGGASVQRAEERRAELLKAAGFNAVRSAHNPISRAFLDACDRIGLLVMDELTDMWTQRKTDYDYSTEFPRHWPELVDSVVDKDYNHPSVIFYSIGNEIQENGSAHGAKIGRRLAQRLKEKDPNRYTVNSANLLMAAMGQIKPPSESSMPQAGQQMKSTDINEIMSNLGAYMAKLVVSDTIGDITRETFSCVDVAGYNYATARHAPDGIKYPNRVVMGSETFPAQIAENWSVAQANSHVIGDFTWTGWDYLGEAAIGQTRYLNEPGDDRHVWPWYIAWCGDLDITGQRRPVSYYREIVFGLRQTPYLTVRYPETFGKTPKPGGWDFVDGVSSWNWEGHEGKPLQVEVYAPGDTAALYLNGRKVAEEKLEGFRAVMNVNYEPGELTAVSYADGNETGRYTVGTAGKEVQLIARADRDQIGSNPGDLAYIDIWLTDSRGRVHIHQDRPVKVKATGAGFLAGLGSADPKSREAFRSEQFTTFEGHLLAIVRPQGQGVITVEIEADGCDPIRLTISAR